MSKKQTSSPADSGKRDDRPTTSTAPPTDPSSGTATGIPATGIPATGIPISAMLTELPQMLAACGLMIWGAINFFSNRESIGQILLIVTSEQFDEFQIGILALIMFLLVAFAPFAVGMGWLYWTLSKISGPLNSTTGK